MRNDQWPTYNIYLENLNLYIIKNYTKNQNKFQKLIFIVFSCLNLIFYVNNLQPLIIDRENQNKNVQKKHMYRGKM